MKTFDFSVINTDITIIVSAETEDEAREKITEAQITGDDLRLENEEEEDD